MAEIEKCPNTALERKKWDSVIKVIGNYKDIFNLTWCE
jgi:hypothetical protein